MELGSEVFVITGEPMAKNSQVEVQNLPLNKIKLGRNSRISVSTEELDGLMQSIKETGLLQPIGVVRSGAGFEICYGNRRFLACSKLGLHRIPAIIHEKKREHDLDLKNLTENIQRRNISLSEVGRFLDLLKKDGLSNAEAAVRLGVSKNYVASCAVAYNEVPKEFRDDLEVQVGKHNDRKRVPGKISVKIANEITSICKRLNLDQSQKRALFGAAKNEERFTFENISKYAVALKRGKEDFLDSVEPVKRISVNFFITEKHKHELEKKFVDEGPFNSVTALCLAILRGEKSIKVDVIR